MPAASQVDIQGEHDAPSAPGHDRDRWGRTPVETDAATQTQIAAECSTYQTSEHVGLHEAAEPEITDEQPRWCPGCSVMPVLPPSPKWPMCALPRTLRRRIRTCFSSHDRSSRSLLYGRCEGVEHSDAEMNWSC